MKTVNLEDDLYWRLKAEAAARRIDTRKLIHDILEAGLHQPEPGVEERQNDGTDTKF